MDCPHVSSPHRSPLPDPLSRKVSRTSPVAVSIIVPARNEEANLGACLRSLTTQAGFQIEIIVVDDNSTDRTREIAQSFPGVRVISAGTPPRGWTGKNNALVVAARCARGDWILFTDADTVHFDGSLARAIEEAKREHAALLSYSPEQEVRTFSERAVMPIVFSELAARYPLKKIRDQQSQEVAANGQYILVRRAAYETTGGHAVVATYILDDVELARRFRNGGHRVFFRYGGDAVRTRMYRNWTQLREGWTKNLSLLFPQLERLAARTLSFWFVAWTSIGIALFGAIDHRYSLCVLPVFWLLLYRRIRAGNFSATNNLIAITFGPPIFAYLLLRSKSAHAHGQVSWKGRSIPIRAAEAQPVAELSLKPQAQPRGLYAKRWN
jgi:glycosyltransferase involved in cell wall biosynthesis